VRQIVRSLGGDVSLRSTLGEGSTFTITLPRLKQEEAPGV
jgi:signal transduction histidine kinase